MASNGNLNKMKALARTIRFVLILIVPLVGKGQLNGKSPETLEGKEKTIFVFVHGAWGGGWEYAMVDSILTERGDRVYRPSLTGLGERVHLANKEIDLTTHIDDIVSVVKFEKLHNIVLIGHSYGGMVISGVAEKIPERIQRLIYLDAFVPRDGESVKSINGNEVWNGMIVPNIKDGYVLYPFGPTKTIPPTDVPQPLKTFTETISMESPLAKKIPTAYILMKQHGKATFEEWGSKRAVANGWKVHEMEGGHYSMRDQPEALVEMLKHILKN